MARSLPLDRAAATKVEDIEAWLELVVETWSVLAADRRVFRVWVRLVHRRSDDLIEDAVTCNMRHFAQLEVTTLDPFSARR